MTSALRAAAAFAFVATAACGGDAVAEPDPLPLSDDTRSPYAESAPAASPSATPSPSSDPADETGPAQPSTHQRWKGSLAQTSPVTFGAGSCSYRITLRQVEIDILAVDGEIAAATVTLTSVEDTLAPCTAAPIPVNKHTYVIASSSARPAGATHLELAPTAGNRPAAALVIDGSLVSGSSPLHLAWHRTDNPAPFDWRVSADVRVTASP